MGGGSDPFIWTPPLREGVKNSTFRGCALRLKERKIEKVNFLKNISQEPVLRLEGDNTEK